VQRLFAKVNSFTAQKPLELSEMFTLTRPTEAKLKTFLVEQKTLPLSYDEVGATHPEHLDIPSGYTKDHMRLYLGQGRAIFEEACRLVKEWHMYDQSWLELYPKPPKIDEGTVGCVAAKHLGFYSVSSFKVIYHLDEEERFAFAIGTLPGHVERGEERFMVEHSGSDAVWLDILAFSRPGQPLVKLGAPFARLMQRRFAMGVQKVFLASL